MNVFNVQSGETGYEVPADSPVETMRTMFGTPRLLLAPVLRGAAADQVIVDPRIAIIDDETSTVKAVKKHLQLVGYRQFFTTSDASQAMGLIAQERPDVVLLDILMPTMSGLEVLEAIRRHEPFLDLPVIILTAASDRETRLKALRLGATEFLAKPLDTVELETRLRNVLIMKAHQDRLKNYAWELELEVAVRSAELAEAHKQVVRCLARVGEYRDNETGNHVLRVGLVAEILARRLGLPREFCGRIREAAALHDIGKVGVPDAVLLKPGKLDPVEFTVMKDHCRKGWNVCLPQGEAPAPPPPKARHEAASVGNSPILELAASIAYTHHERWDGTGYPCGLRGEEIPIEGRITAVADVFDALTHARPYKAAFSVEESLRILQEERGSHFDPQVLDAFFDSRDEILEVYRTHADLTPNDGPSTV